MTATLLRKYRVGSQNSYHHFNTYERLSMLNLPNLQYCLYYWPQQELFLLCTLAIVEPRAVVVFQKA